MAKVFGWYGHAHGPGWILLSLLSAVLWITLVFVVVSLVKSNRQGKWTDDRGGSDTGSRSITSPAQSILQERLARGEIDEEDYRRLSAVLREN